MNFVSKPVAVLIGDIHFTVPTLELATKALVQAKEKAIQLTVPLVINGDTLDTKAVIRAECANRLIEILDDSEVNTYVNIGNHDRLSEKSKEHSLNFLRPFTSIIEYPIDLNFASIIPYQNDPQEFKNILDSHIEGHIIICHQGVVGANLGHYIQDNSAVAKEMFKGKRVILSHYHRRQNIGKNISYLGNPYSLSFGEAADGDKGFSILNDDGSLTFVPTNLRKHVILDLVAGQKIEDPDNFYGPEDLLWCKIKGKASELVKIKKKDIAKMLGRDMNFKLDLIVEEESRAVIEKPLSDIDTLDKLIDELGESTTHKTLLKSMSRELLE